MGFFKDLGRAVDIIFNPDEYTDLGSTGERFTYNELKSICAEERILRNVYIKKENGELTEIDLLMVSRFGIFVFESKNYSGWIFGNANQAKWTQTLPNGFKQKFYNPVWQNKTHIKSLQLMLEDVPNIKYYSVIVFSERCELKSIECDEQDVYIIKRENLKRLMKKFERQDDGILENATIRRIIDILSGQSRPGKEVAQLHMKELNESLSKCPWCKSELVERVNKKTGNKFYGCVSFPKCKYTKPVE